MIDCISPNPKGFLFLQRRRAGWLHMKTENMPEIYKRQMEKEKERRMQPSLRSRTTSLLTTPPKTILVSGFSPFRVFQHSEYFLCVILTVWSVRGCTVYPAHTAFMDRGRYTMNFWFSLRQSAAIVFFEKWWFNKPGAGIWHLDSDSFIKQGLREQRLLTCMQWGNRVCITWSNVKVRRGAQSSY